MKLKALFADRKKLIAVGALAFVVVFWLRSRRASTGISAADTSTVPVDTSGGTLSGLSGGGGGATVDPGSFDLAPFLTAADIAPVQASLEGLGTQLGDVQAALADFTSQKQSATTAAFQATQAANDVRTATAPTPTPAAPTPFVTPTPTRAAGDGGQGAGAFTPAYATYIQNTYGITPAQTVKALSQPLPIPTVDYESLNRARVALAGTPVRMESLVAPPVATLPPAPIPVNDSPAPAPPAYPIPAVAGTPPTPASIAHVNPTIEGSSTSAIATHLRYGRDPNA